MELDAARSSVSSLTAGHSGAFGAELTQWRAKCAKLEQSKRKLTRQCRHARQQNAQLLHQVAASPRRALHSAPRRTLVARPSTIPNPYCASRSKPYCASPSS